MNLKLYFKDFKDYQQFKSLWMQKKSKLKNNNVFRQKKSS